MSSIYEHLSKGGSKVDPQAPDMAIPERPHIVKPSKPPELTPFKILVLISVIVSVFASILTYTFYQKWRETRNERIDLVSRYEKLQNTSQALETRAAAYQASIEKVREQLQAFRAQRGDFENEIQRSRIEISNLRKKLLELEDKNNKLERETSSLKRQISSTEPVPAVTAGSFAPVQPVRPQAEDYAEPSVSEQFPQNRTVETSRTTEAAPPGGTGSMEGREGERSETSSSPQVMTVNRKFNFVVVNLGLDDNLKMGGRLGVMRDGRQIGTLEIEKLYDNFAAATIQNEREDMQIQEGDVVALLS